MAERVVDRKLNLEEMQGREAFLGRLNVEDRAAVDRIIGAVNTVASVYFELYPAHWDNDFRGEPDYNAGRFRSEKTDEQGYPFFSVHGIGGYVTQEGERKDVDLLVVTNFY